MDMQIQALRTQMVEKKQASDTLYYTVREAIATGLLPMGTRLREEDLAEEQAFYRFVEEQGL